MVDLDALDVQILDELVGDDIPRAGQVLPAYVIANGIRMRVGVRPSTRKIMFRLRRLALADRVRMEAFGTYYQWKITDAGRAVLAASR